MAALAGPAAADDFADGKSDGDKVEISAGGSRRSVDVGAEEGTTSNGCNWTIYVGDDLTRPVYENRVDLVDDAAPIAVPNPAHGASRLFSQTGRWFQATGCNPQPGLDTLNGVYAEGDSISMAELRDEAINNVDPPNPTTFGTSPDDDGAGRFPVVQIPTWFWIEDPYWQTEWSAIATFPGPPGAVRVWAEAFADPDRTEWSAGDGSPWQECGGQGEVWQPGMPEDATTCSHTYTWPSVDEPGLAYQVQGRVWFRTWWTTNIAGQGAGPLPPISRETAVRQIRVGEIQAVES
ncbi:MAG: hypothetical protein AAF547_10510 [Actinomycetota bacterium]